MFYEVTTLEQYITLCVLIVVCAVVIVHIGK